MKDTIVVIHECFADPVKAMAELSLACTCPAVAPTGTVGQAKTCRGPALCIQNAHMTNWSHLSSGLFHTLPLSLWSGVKSPPCRQMRQCKLFWEWNPFLLDCKVCAGSWGNTEGTLVTQRRWGRRGWKPPVWLAGPAFFSVTCSAT